MGGSTFDIALRCGGDRFVKVGIRLVVIYDEQARQSGVLVMSSEGGEEDFLLREATAKVADRVSRMIAYDLSGERLWPKPCDFCQETFEAPSGWLLLHERGGEKRVHFTFGLRQDHLGALGNGARIGDCPCTELGIEKGEPCAVNSLDCTGL